MTKAKAKAKAKALPKKALPKDARIVTASARNDITIPFFSNVLQPTDVTLAERGKGKGLAIYDEIERDTHAWAVLQKRKKHLVGREWEVKPSGEDQIDLDAAEFVEEQLGALPFDRICEDLLDATLKGYAISEIVWDRIDNRIVPKRVLSHDQRRFVFDLKWKPRLLTTENMQDGIQLPERKFIVHRHGVKGNNPYGLGMGTRLFWPTLFKREGIAFWLVFLEKFASPTVVGKTPYGLTDEEEDKLVNSLASVVQNSAILAPMGVDVDFLEASRGGSVSYQDFCRYWDTQMSIAVLGETLTTDIQGSGSRAASQTHADILNMLIDADADLLSSTLRETLVRWMVELNIPGAKVPDVWRTRPANEQEIANTLKLKAEASGENDTALRQIVVTSSAFENDDDARNYIQAMAPDDIDAEILDQLVKARHTFETLVAPTSNPKKKVLTSDETIEESDTTSFADAADSSDEDVQTTLVEHLLTFGDDWDADRLSRITAVLDAAETLEDAAKQLLTEYTKWDAAPFAETIELALNAGAYAGRAAVLAEMNEDANFASDDVFRQPFKEQIDFFKQKSVRPTAVWTDVMRGDHDRAFAVAGAKDLDMLRDFQEALQSAMQNGTTLETFRKNFDKITSKYGWSYDGERGWRTRVIFETNMRTSHMAGRLKQMRDPDVLKARPFWQYRHGQTRRPIRARREHLAWNGLILRADNPFWILHFPPNDWKCSCGVRTLSQRDLDRMQKDGPDPSPPTRMKTQIDKATGQIVDRPAGIGKGFEYQPGDLWERGLVPSQLDRLASKSLFTVDDAEPILDLVANGRALKSKELRSGKPAEFYVDAFLKGFGAKRGKAVLFEDKAGTSIPITDELFRTADGEYKVLKRGREVNAAQLGEAIRDPDEIWVGVSEIPIASNQGGGKELVIDRKYIRVDPKTGLLAVFEMTKGYWSAKTAFAPLKKNSTSTNVNAINKRRSGVLIYKRK
jgi:hypothetical protein